MWAPIGLVAIVALLAAMLSGRMTTPVAPVAPVAGMCIVAVPCFSVMTDAALDRIGAVMGIPAASVRRCRLPRLGTPGSSVTRSQALDARGETPGGSLPALDIGALA